MEPSAETKQGYATVHQSKKELKRTLARELCTPLDIFITRGRPLVHLSILFFYQSICLPVFTFFCLSLFAVSDSVCQSARLSVAVNQFVSFDCLLVCHGITRAKVDTLPSPPPPPHSHTHKNVLHDSETIEEI